MNDLFTIRPISSPEPVPPLNQFHAETADGTSATRGLSNDGPYRLILSDFRSKTPPPNYFRSVLSPQGQSEARPPSVLSPQASLVLFYRPTAIGMKG
ncbi:hypothetical protein TNCV_1632761 [Trichonephila clavipes]|nr:hypothetical protein TNCV_1632761 [Trichonephila clavipes]